MSCETDNCQNAATYRFTWPGRNEMRACSACAKKAATVAQAMGFDLEVKMLAAAIGGADDGTLGYVELGFQLLEWLSQQPGDRATKGGALALALGVLVSQAPDPTAAAEYFGKMIVVCSKLPGLDELKDPAQ